MEDERRPKRQEEMKSISINKEDAYFKALDEERLKAAEMRKQRRRMVCKREGAPADGCILEEEVLKGIVVDRCPTCEGVWLDPHELAALEKAIRGKEEGMFERFIKHINPYHKE